MRHSLSVLCLLFLSLGVALPELSADDDKDAPGKKDSPTKKDTAPKPAPREPKKDKRTGVLTGKLVQVEGAQRYLTLEVTNKIPQENTGAIQNISNLRRQLIGNRDPNSIRSIYADIAKNSQNVVTYKDETKKIELFADDDMKVRTMLVPIDYDEKGKIKKLTEKEKKALRGPDPSLPGYTADFDSLKTSQTVKVYLAKSKGAGKIKYRDKDGAIDARDQLKVLMVVILAEPPAK